MRELVDQFVYRLGLIAGRAFDACEHMPRPVCMATAGAAIALGIATLFSCRVGILMVLRGTTYFPEHQVAGWQVIGAYYLAALIAGPICGLLWTFTRSGVGTFLVGTFGGTVVFAMTARILPDAADAPIGLALVGGVLIGGCGALFARHEEVPWCPSLRTLKTWWGAAIVGMPVLWLVGVTWRPSETVAVLAMLGFLSLALVVAVVTLIRSGATVEDRRHADTGSATQ